MQQYTCTRARTRCDHTRASNINTSVGPLVNDTKLVCRFTRQSIKYVFERYD